MRYRKNKNLWPYLHILCYDSFFSFPSPVGRIQAAIAADLLAAVAVAAAAAVAVQQVRRKSLRPVGAKQRASNLNEKREKKNKIIILSKFKRVLLVVTLPKQAQWRLLLMIIVLHKFISVKRRVWLIRYLWFLVWEWPQEISVKAHESSAGVPRCRKKGEFELFSGKRISISKEAYKINLLHQI